LRRVLTHSVYALLVLGGTMGAAPGHTTTTPVLSPPVFLPLPAPKTVAAEQPSSKPYQVGKASWYGGLFQGKETASGEDYNMYDFTAAHRELPLGTLVRVTNLKNHKVVIVRINDRGPVTPGRIIDLSYNAAKRLEISGKGVQKVQLDILDGQSSELALNQKPSIN
jgi:rare lipoprotein A